MNGKGRLKRVLTLFLCLLLCISCTSSTAALVFNDVQEGDWYSDAVNYVSDIGLMVGTSTNRFSPKAPVTRAMFAQVLYNMSGHPDVDYSTAQFSDVKTSAWYNKAVTWAREHEIIAGYGNNRFGPEDSITREQLVTILHRYTVKTDYYGLEESPVLRFVDHFKISDWALSSMEWAVREKVITGAGNYLNPQSTATRAEIAQIMSNYCKKIITSDFLEFDDIAIPDVIDTEIEPAPDGYSHLINEDLFIVKQDEAEGFIAVKYIGDTDFPLNVSISKGEEKTTYRCYAGNEYRYGYPYGEGDYHLQAILYYDGNKGSIVKDIDFSVSESEYKKSLTSSSSFYNFPTQTSVYYKANELWDADKSDYDNALAVYRWMNSYLSYDYDRTSEVSWGYHPDYDLMFERKGGICLDFASMYCAMMRAKNIPSRIIVGWVEDSNGSRGYHAWSQIYLNNEWISIDPTYGICATDAYFYADLWDVAFNMEKSGRIESYTVDYIY